jgi:UDP-N-acetyl-D-mannosaminuronic acid transferase (WecB/TagA/CpsF family)
MAQKLRMEREYEHYRRILGVRFFTGSAEDAVVLAMRGGLVVVPSAPVLVKAAEDAATQRALAESDLAITDSGLMILLWLIMKWERIPRVSGLAYLKLLLREPAVREPGATLWVMPDVKSAKRNSEWLRANGCAVNTEDCYIAPNYGEGALEDSALLALVQARKPAHIIMAIGGGVQERLGHFIRNNAGCRPAIHCTGAAIGFLSGEQVNIPPWADRFFLGWLFRCIQSPSRFIPRYVKATKLVFLMLRWRARVPGSTSR